MSALTAAELREMQRETAARLYQKADRWRMAATGRRVLYLQDERVSIFPGGDVSITNDSTGIVGARSTYVGAVARSSDVQENDQYRNVRHAGTGEVYMPGVRFTIGTVAIHQTSITLRLHEEGT